MPDALEHITITTGSSRISPRSEVDDDAITFIRTAMAERNGKLGDTGWRVKLLPTPGDGGHVFDLMIKGKAVIRNWLCANPALSGAMWKAASEVGALPGTRLHPPLGVPWLAVTILPDGLSLYTSDPEKLMEAGDLERCVAWTLLE